MGPMWLFYSCVSCNMRRVDFHGLMGSQRTPRVWGVTFHALLRNSEILDFDSYGAKTGIFIYIFNYIF